MCTVKFTFHAKSHLTVGLYQTLILYLKCSKSLSFRANFLSQSVQLKGRSPEWERWWSTSFCWVARPLPQSWHVSSGGWTRLCALFTWRVRSRLLATSLPHSAHLKKEIFKATVQWDGSGSKWSHLIDLYRMESRGDFQRILPAPILLKF